LTLLLRSLVIALLSVVCTVVIVMEIEKCDPNRVFGSFQKKVFSLRKKSVFFAKKSVLFLKNGTLGILRPWGPY
jgi:hypothetical protein